MRWPWISRKRLEETEDFCREAMTTCRRALALAEESVKLREDLARQTEATLKLAALLVEIDERFLKQIGVKLPEEK